MFSEFVIAISHQLMIITFLKSTILDKTFKASSRNKTIKLPIKQKSIISLTCSRAHILKAITAVEDGVYFILTTCLFVKFLMQPFLYRRLMFSCICFFTAIFLASLGNIFTSHLVFPEKKGMVFQAWSPTVTLHNMIIHSGKPVIQC